MTHIMDRIAAHSEKPDVYDPPSRNQLADVRAAFVVMKAALEKLDYWFDADPEVLDAMSADERRDHERQHCIIRQALTVARSVQK